MCIDTPVHVAEMSVCCQVGDKFCSARWTSASCKCECSCSSDGNTGGGGCSDKVASSVASILDIEKKVLDLEGKNSDICHVINCISHFL